MFVLLYAVASTFVACRNETAAPAGTATASGQTSTVAGPPRDMKNARIDTKVPLRPPVVSKCVLGSARSADGAVSEQKTTFTTKEPIYVSLWLNEAPAGLRVRLLVTDEKEQNIAHVQVPAAGKKMVTMRVNETLKPGKYHLESFWGGNSVCEHDITVRK